MENGSMAAWLPDGYTQSAFLEPITGLHGPVRFQFRPLLVLMQAEVNRELAAAGDDLKKRQHIAARWMANQLVSWDIKKPNGELADHRLVDDILRLRPMVFTRMWNIITGAEGGDVDDQQSPMERQVQSLRETAAAAMGMPQERTDEGN